METFYANLPEGHVLKTLYREHEIILKTLDEITELNTKIQGLSTVEDAENDLDKLHHLAIKVTESEPHHQREEQALFPVMIERGMAGPPTVMTMEHEPIHKYKHDLKDITVNYNGLSWDEIRTKINSTCTGLCEMLSSHIQKENLMCYPMAFQGIPEEHVWQDMKKKCDRIGYCSFTP